MRGHEHGDAERDAGNADDSAPAVPAQIGEDEAEDLLQEHAHGDGREHGLGLLAVRGVPAGREFFHFDSFHRAHQAVYLHQLIQSGDSSWTLAGGNTRPDMAETISALVAQGGAYTLETISPAGEHRYERITSIRKVIPWTADLAGLVAQATSQRVTLLLSIGGGFTNENSKQDDKP